MNEVLEAIRVTENIPMAHVADVDRSIQFYKLLGFACDSRFSGAQDVTNWALVSSGKAKLMLARASGPVIACQQAVLFYMYAPNVRQLRKHLLENSIADAGQPPMEGDFDPASVPSGAVVFDVAHRFYMPDGELRVHDPDSYVLLIGQLG